MVNEKSWANDSFKCRKFTAVVNALNFFLFFVVSLRTVTQGTIKYPTKRNNPNETDVKPEERLKKNLLKSYVAIWVHFDVLRKFSFTE